VLTIAHANELAFGRRPPNMRRRLSLVQTD